MLYPVAVTNDGDGPRRRRGLSRRGLLGSAGVVAAVGAAAAAGVETEVLPGRSWAYRRLGLDGSDGRVPRAPAGRTQSGSFVSRARLGAECGWTIARPPGVRGELPVVVVLHGRRNDHADAFRHSYLALGAYLADVVGRGTAPFALASVDGGDTYWHARDSGEDAGAMVVEEFLPLLRRKGLDTSRFGLLGWSMGGFGALHLAMQLGPDRVAAVGAMSPALFADAGATPAGAFDDRADFEAVTPFGRQDQLDGIALRIDCGEGDPFYGAVKDYREGFARKPAGGFSRGDHDAGFWRRVAPAQLAFLGKALTRT